MLSQKDWQVLTTASSVHYHRLRAILSGFGHSSQFMDGTGGVCLGVLTVTRFVPGTQNGCLAVIEEQEKDKLRYCPWNLEVRGKERHCNQVRKLWYLNYPNPIQTLNILRQRYLQKDFNQMCGFEKWPKDMPIYFLLTLRWLRAKIDDLWWPSYIHCVTTC